MIDYVTIEIGSNGSTVMVEPELRHGLTRRVFRRIDRKSTRLNSSHSRASRMPSSA